MNKTKQFSDITSIYQIQAIISSAMHYKFAVVVDLQAKEIGIISINTPVGHFSGLNGTKFFNHHAKYYPALLRFADEIYELTQTK